VCGVVSIEPETSRRQAELFRRQFEGWVRYGLSAFYARSDDEVLDLGEDRLDAFASLFVSRLADDESTIRKITRRCGPELIDETQPGVADHRRRARCGQRRQGPR
jgi:hypothetical protein